MSRDPIEPDPVKIKVGMPSDPKEISVEIPEGDPFPWQLGDAHAVVGKRQPRLDAAAKVTGRAKYTHDINLPGMLFAKFVRCPYARATVKSVDPSEALKLDGVKVAKEYLMRSGKEVRYAWQAVAIVAATTRQVAEEAARLVKVEYEVLPHAARFDQAVAEGAPQVLGNRKNRAAGQGGSPPAQAAKTDAALKAAAHVVSAVATTQVQTHSCLETKGVVAHWEAPDRLKVWASTQGTFSVRGELAEEFGVPEPNVTVITHYMGGGFGSKFGAGYFGVAAARLAKETGLPVKLMLDRKEEHTSGGNRPSSVQDMTLGVSDKGDLVGYRVTLEGTAGVGGGAGAANPLIYQFKEVDRAPFEVATNAGAGAAFRAPGHPQGSFAVESIMDLAAEALGMDPLELRLKNDPHPIRQFQYREGAKLFGWDKRKKNGSDAGPIKRGIGVSAAKWFQLGGPGADVMCRIRKDGSVEVRNGAQDIGTGTRTIMAMVAAEELGLPVGGVTAFLGDTNDPIGPGSGGSTTAPTIMPAVRQAAFQAGRQLRMLVAEKWGRKATDLLLAEGTVREVSDAKRSMPWADACRLIQGDEIAALGKRPRNYAAYQDRNGGTGGVQFAEVEVDTELGQVSVKRFLALQDCGTIVNPLLAESQVNGAIIQGISYALFEERHLDRKLGQMVNADFELYKIAGSLDMPEVKVVLTEVVNGGNNVGLCGLGEGPAVPVAAAIACAVHNAIGVRVLSLPMTPDKVLKALEARKGGQVKNFDYVMPRTAEEAAAAGLKPGAVLKGAGIDLLERMKEGVARPDALVNLLAITDMSGIRQDGDTIRIGALTTLFEIESSELIRKVAAGLADAAAEAATPQVRNRATLGGNLAQRPRCWYFRNETYDCSKKSGSLCYALEGENKYHAIFDNKACCIVHPSNLAPPLWALDATIHVTSAAGDAKTSDIEIAKFWIKPDQDIKRENVLKPGQVITAVSFKAPAAGTGTAYLETREKESFDWALTSVACRITLGGGAVKEARVVVSGVAPTPLRLEAVEKMIEGKPMSPEAARAAGEKATAGATPLRDNAYKVRHLAVNVTRTLQAAAKRAGESK